MTHNMDVVWHHFFSMFNGYGVWHVCDINMTWSVLHDMDFICTMFLVMFKHGLCDRSMCHQNVTWPIPHTRDIVEHHFLSTSTGGLYDSMSIVTKIWHNLSSHAMMFWMIFHHISTMGSVTSGCALKCDTTCYAQYEIVLQHVLSATSKCSMSCSTCFASFSEGVQRLLDVCYACVT